VEDAASQPVQHQIGRVSAQSRAHVRKHTKWSLQVTILNVCTSTIYPTYHGNRGGI